MKLESYLEQLRENHLKVTPKRKAIISLLLKEKRYFSPLEIWDRLKSDFARLGLPTTYRILEELNNIGVLARIEKKDRHLYYFLCNLSPVTHHHHFVCRECKRVEAVDYCNFRSIDQYVEKKLGCRAESHSLQIEGLCKECKSIL